MKKWFSITILSFFVFGITSAMYSSKKETKSWKSPIYGEIHFSAFLANNQVKMQWSKFVPKEGEIFRYYKVIRSESNANPVYPDDGYIKYASNIDFTQYTDKNPKSAYYRVCAMTNQRNRYCSNVIWITVETSKENPSPKYNTKKQIKPKKEKPDGILSMEIKQKLDRWIVKLKQKLTQSKLSTTQKLEKINRIESVLKRLASTRQVFIPVYQYLRIPLEKIKTEIKANDMSDLDSLLEKLLE